MYSLHQQQQYFGYSGNNPSQHQQQQQQQHTNAQAGPSSLSSSPRPSGNGGPYPDVQDQRAYNPYLSYASTTSAPAPAKSHGDGGADGPLTGDSGYYSYPGTGDQVQLPPGPGPGPGGNGMEMEMEMEMDFRRSDYYPESVVGQGGVYWPGGPLQQAQGREMQDGYREQGQGHGHGHMRGQGQGQGQGQWDSPYSAHTTPGLAGQYAPGPGPGPPPGQGQGPSMDGYGWDGRGGMEIRPGEDDGKREILLLHQNLTELITLLVPYRLSPTNPSPSQPPPFLLPRLAHLAHAVYTTLHHLSPRFRLNIDPDRLPALPISGIDGSVCEQPRKKAKKAAAGAAGGSKGKDEDGRGLGLTAAEREMEVIRVRRDALIARSKEGPRARAGMVAAAAAAGVRAGAGSAGSMKREKPTAGRAQGEASPWPEEQEGYDADAGAGLEGGGYGRDPFDWANPNPDSSSGGSMPQRAYPDDHRFAAASAGFGSSRSSPFGPFGRDGDLPRQLSNGLVFGPPPDSHPFGATQLGDGQTGFSRPPSSLSMGYGIDPSLRHAHLESRNGAGGSAGGETDVFDLFPPPSSASAQQGQGQAQGQSQGQGQLFDFGLDLRGSPIPVSSTSTTAMAFELAPEVKGKRLRCHGCGVVVEGEWMGGPDGPKSLCVRCGLHYAKLKKKRPDEADTDAGTEPEAGTDVRADAADESGTATVIPDVLPADPLSTGLA